MKRKFNFKRFSLVLTMVVCLTLFAFNAKKVTYATFKTIGSIFNTNDTVVISFEKDDNSDDTFSVLGQTLVYSQTYYDGELEQNSSKHYYINVYNRTTNNVVIINGNDFTAEVEAKTNYYIAVQTDENIDPTDLCLDVNGKCIELNEYEDGKDDARTATSGDINLDEDITIVLREKAPCDRINCDIRGVNVQMQDDNGHYYGIMNYRI